MTSFGQESQESSIDLFKDLNGNCNFEGVTYIINKQAVSINIGGLEVHAV